MNSFIHDMLTCFRSFVSWSFNTPSGFGVSIGGLLVAINVLAVVAYYLWDRYK